ncbi:arsenical pump-driving ATPase [Methylotuvimicrobium alcaliphilum]|uniref:Arsenical pump-driving ATPase n=1 Tax=Methylotuvimicrobium alcaliphilum (strain DSM 19304 / NCIMB 14124 / VKM B-2133 / 20Z) TaxID=1091494 RepID=G4T2A2_META2|nr:arsenical pump-driving ATPase [Methylotuvimicrobium alcaliphilum]CCE23542.1 Arsenical pump-driving ATPase [Methylotuvimicrobium alcaliphilum 20Z]
MNFLQQLPKFLFFTGKGGVGKTSLSCATAVHLADAGKKVLLVSTDPASNVGQVFGTVIGHRIAPISEVGNLEALEIDPVQAAALYRERIVGPIRGKLPESAVNSIEEQLSGACTTEIAAFDEFTALLTDAELIKRYDHIVFDTAPTGHTIRLLQLPGAWGNFIESNPEGASCLGPLAGLEKQQQRYQQAVAALSDPSRTRLVLVARAQSSTLQEVARTSGELADTGLSNQYLVINGLMPESETSDPLAEAIFQRESRALKSLLEPLRELKTDYTRLLPCNLVGLNALRSLLNEDQQTAEATDGNYQLPDLPSLQAMIDEMAQPGHGLIMLMGKGGVGKTTLSAAIAIALAERGYRVLLTTTDPAAHLTETLAGEIDNLTVSRIDPQAETERYRQHILETKGKKLDTQGRALLEEDLRSPCTEEIAVFQAFSGAIREASAHFVVMDTAPTGHTLLLLDATGSYHREIARHMEGKSLHFKTPMMRLQDPEQTKVLIATLAETTPVLEAANLQEDLRRAGIEPWAWIVNSSLVAARPTSALLRQRANEEQQQLALIRQDHAERLAIVPVQMREPVGVERLRALLSSK